MENIKHLMGIELANINNWGLSFSKMGVWGFGDWFNPMIFEFDEFFHCFLILKNLKNFFINYIYY